MAKKRFSKRPPKKSTPLNKRQRHLVQDNVEKRIRALQEQSALQATVVSHMGYNIIVQTGADEPLLACDWRQNIGAICAGDEALITQQSQSSDNRVADNATADNHYRIEAVLPRKTVIAKQNTYRGEKPFAANIDQLLLLITHQPMFQASLLDRYLIMAQAANIETLIYFNKLDILKRENDIQHCQRMQSIYQQIPGIRWLQGSIKNERGLADLTDCLKDKKTVITGQSGVGKSSLINALIPDIEIQTMSISQASGLGRHSTTNSTLYYLDKKAPCRGILIDTPGVRSFDTYHLKPEQIAQGFVEISPYLGCCGFSDCSHTHEKNCAVKRAVSDGKISQLRYDSFLQILTECQHYER